MTAAIVRLPTRTPTSFGFEPGTVLAKKYVILELLGSGWEGEVYKVLETGTGIIRAAKFFFPKRNKHNKAIRFYARKLHKLRHCSILIPYHTQDTISDEFGAVTFLVSDFVEGEILSRFLNRQPRSRLTTFEALHLLHTLAAGIEAIHDRKEYHGDLHTDNIIIQRRGIHFDVKLVDLFSLGTSNAEKIREDVFALVKIFHESIGGPRRYAKQSAVVKDLCRGLKRSLITRKFRTAGQLREYLENMEWPE